MKFITGKDRKQTCLFPISLEDSIDPDNSVRAINQFVDQLDLTKLGFRQDFNENGPPAYHPTQKPLRKCFLQLYRLLEISDLLVQHLSLETALSGLPSKFVTIFLKPLF